MELESDVEEGAVGLSIEKDSKASSLTALLLSDSKDFPFRDQALMSILASNPVRAIQYRDKARDNSTLAHLRVVSDRPEILQRLIELLGEHVLNEVDAKGRNPEVLAVELNRHACLRELKSEPGDSKRGSWHFNRFPVAYQYINRYYLLYFMW